MSNSIELPCTDEEGNSTIVCVEQDEGFVSIELELNDGGTNMTLLSIDDAKELRDFLIAELGE